MPVHKVAHTPLQNGPRCAILRESRGKAPLTQTTLENTNFVLVSHAFLTLLFEAEEAEQGGVVELPTSEYEEAAAFEAARLLCLTGLLAPTNLEGVFTVANHAGVLEALEREQSC